MKEMLFSKKFFLLAASGLMLASTGCKKDDPAPNTVVNAVVNNGYSTLATLVTNEIGRASCRERV